MYLKNLESINFVNLNDDEAASVSGGVLDCTEENRSRVLSGLQASGLINAEQVGTLTAIPLETFCTDFDDFLEARLGAKVFNEITTAVEPSL